MAGTGGYRAKRRADVERICKERGIAIERRGCAYVLSGPGISILTTDLAHIDDASLRPIHLKPTWISST